MSNLLLYNAQIINEGRRFCGYVAVDGERISEVAEGMPPQALLNEAESAVDLKGKWLLPGAIDDQVHFREPGLTHKADIASESRAAVAGGVTSFMDMPNCKPQTVSIEAWEDKMRRGAQASAANYAFWIGATNDNIEELRRADMSRIPGVKVFLGASTGNMLVNSEEALDAIFSLPAIIAIHSEDEKIIADNKKKYAALYPEGVPVSCHPLIRSREACSVSTERAIERARRLGTRLHILHISTADEARMLESVSLDSKTITAEVCVHHLWFTDADYARLGNRIKWNPAVKTVADRDELRRAVEDGRIDIIATDHAPHLPEEKEGDALTAASGGPLVQHSLPMMLSLARRGIFTPEKVVEYMAHRPARLFGVKERGFIRPGYFADLVVVNPDKEYQVTKENILTKCGWSPLEGETLDVAVETTYVNGHKAYDKGCLAQNIFGKPLEFNNKGR